jgi:hypothetical protein
MITHNALHAGQLCAPVKPLHMWYMYRCLLGSAVSVLLRSVQAQAAILPPHRVYTNQPTIVQDTAGFSSHVPFIELWNHEIDI